jgi:hypothetical protein
MALKLTRKVKRLLRQRGVKRVQVLLKAVTGGLLAMVTSGGMGACGCQGGW